MLKGLNAARRFTYSLPKVKFHFASVCVKKAAHALRKAQDSKIHPHIPFPINEIGVIADNHCNCMTAHELPEGRMDGTAREAQCIGTLVHLHAVDSRNWAASSRCSAAAAVGSCGLTALLHREYG
jgi:hypothetical protein